MREAMNVHSELHSVTIRYCLDRNYRPRAARVAGLLRKELGLNAELIRGEPGEFTVWVANRMVARKSAARFPSDRKVLTAVRRAIV